MGTVRVCACVYARAGDRGHKNGENRQTKEVMKITNFLNSRCCCFFFAFLSRDAFDNENA